VPAELRVMSSLATKEAYLELLPQFEKSSGHKVATSWVGMVDILKRIKGGETTDVVIGSAAAVDELTQAGKLAAPRTDIAKSGVGVAVRAGAPRPDISSGEAVKRALLKAGSIGYSSGPSGVYLSRLFEKWGVAAELKPKITQTQPGVAVGALVARGEVEIGFQQVSELLPVAGIDLIGPLPADEGARRGARAARVPRLAGRGGGDAQEGPGARPRSLAAGFSSDRSVRTTVMGMPLAATRSHDPIFDRRISMRLTQAMFLGAALALAGSAFAADNAKNGKQDKSFLQKQEDKGGALNNESSFRVLDKNHDGYLTRAEAAGNADLAKRFKEADSNNDGKLSRVEYFKIMAKIDTHSTANKVSRKTESKPTSAAGGTKSRQ
jgi:molybdate transport system substrate-binding protein